ncbi:MATE family efflux transporter [Microbulbifer taiwanensis]|uniref:Multidrug export protein MepA n=2 Tax=Microbulbifer taiwanensis TaxID=986746 RepID=A0ABW1YJR6_9GAMM|nr:MATE family efflux transporter [Microbulbifer taiwanensis]
MPDTAGRNIYLSGSLASVYVRTAAPIILMMLVNGSFNLVDAYFLGIYVGADALAAVTAMFPAFMLIVALSTLVSTGFASVMARTLGAGNGEAARETIAQATTLLLLVCGVLVGLFALFGKPVTAMANNGVAALAGMSYEYISILIFFSPLNFILAINGDSLRCEGHVGPMALVSLSSVLLNAVLNYIFIAQLHWGVAGSAWGTVAAQALALAMVILFRRSHKPQLRLPVIGLSRRRRYWREFLALGAPSSLTYIGIALLSAAILYNLQQWSDGGTYAATVGAYGIITRLNTFIFLPLLGLSLAFQGIAGNNLGAGEYARTNRSVKIAIGGAFVYCLLAQLLLWSLKDSLGSWFVDDTAIIAEVGRILSVSLLALFLLGPLFMVSIFFQSIGDAKRAGLLGLAKTYLFALPLVFTLPSQLGEWGIWFAAPVAEVMALLLTLAVLAHRARRYRYRLGLFYTPAHR